MSFVSDKGTSNSLKRIILKRSNLIRNYLHHTSKYIIDYCVSNDIGIIIIGHNKDWKQGINIGKKSNQNFVSIPFSTLIQQIVYKAEENSIKVIQTEESYTSKVDHLAYEELRHSESYLGKRVKRGLFQSSTKRLLNADINGAIGIARKVIGDSILEQIANRGFVFNPVRINSFNKGI